MQEFDLFQIYNEYFSYAKEIQLLFENQPCKTTPHTSRLLTPHTSRLPPDA